MDCTCEYDGDGAPVEDITTTYPKAQSVWICHECGRSIQPGEEYEKVRCMFEGERTVFRTCLGCYRLRDSAGLGWCGGVLAKTVKRCFGVDIRVTPTPETEA